MPSSRPLMAEPPPQRPLQGRHIVVTRPAGQAAHLAEALRAQGAIPVLFPVLSILDVNDPRQIRDIGMRLEQFDLAIFVSANAIAKALSVILPMRSWPARTRIATMGRSSEMALAEHGLQKVIAPQQRFDSESLLALPELLSVQGWKVIIFRGDGGRDLMGETLVARGARVDYVECYRRAMPQQDAAPLLKLWSDGVLDAVTLTSSEGLRNFLHMIGKLGQTWLRKTAVFVPHQRIGEVAREAGLQQVVVTEPGDDGLIDGLMQYFRNDGTDTSR